MNQQTHFIETGTETIVCTLDELFTPVESLTQVYLKGKKIEHLAYEDTINDSGISRKIYFRYYKEPAGQPVKQTEISY